jgi:hypothetical protein
MLQSEFETLTGIYLDVLLMVIDSLPDPSDRIMARQLVSTTIMTKDMTDLIDALRKQGMAGFKEKTK